MTLEHAAFQIASERAKIMDEALREMLERNGIAWSSNPRIVRSNLDKAGYELVRDEDRTIERTVITFRLVKRIDMAVVAFTPVRLGV